MADQPRREYLQGAARFLALICAKKWNKADLVDTAGIDSSTLTSWENARRAPQYVFMPREDFDRLANALKLSRGALYAWWVDGDDGLLPRHVIDDIRQFEKLPKDQKLARMNALGWQLRQGRQPRSKPSSGD